LKEGSDGQAIVVKVLPDSSAKRSGVAIGDVLSVSYISRFDFEEI
jgi:S1-C subfamily serine protease